jgi:hypothetical protein
MFLSDHEARVARQRHNELLDQARHRRLVREARAARQPGASLRDRVAAFLVGARAALLAPREARRSMRRDTA